MTLVANRAPSTAVAMGLVVLTLLLFALAETCLSPTLAPIVNDLAADELRGRYNGTATLAWTTGFMLGPAIGGAALGRGLMDAYLLGLVAVCGLAASAALQLARHLPDAANRIHEAAGEPALVGAV